MLQQMERTLVNHGAMEAGSINGNNNTNIKNGCYLNIAGNISIWHTCYGEYFRSHLRGAWVIMEMTMTL